MLSCSDTRTLGQLSPENAISLLLYCSQHGCWNVVVSLHVPTGPLLCPETGLHSLKLSLKQETTTECKVTRF